MKSEAPDTDTREHEMYRGLSWIPGILLGAMIIAVLAATAN